MKIDKFKIYVLEIILFIFLLFALFESNIVTKTSLAVILFVYMIICVALLKKRKSPPIYHRQVTAIMTIFSILYLAGFYLLGLYFGYYQATVKLSMWSLWKYIIPLTVIIVSSEVIRNVLISQKGEKTKGLAFIIMVLIDLIIYTGVYDLSNLDDFATVISFILFASVACNLLYNYVSSKFGYKGVIIYRLVTILYAYIIPIVPNIYVFFRSVIRMIYPYVIYLILDYTYAKTTYTTDYVDQRKKAINTTSLVIFAVLLSMLVSCQFRFGILVIGSPSMTGTINKGDAAVFERYETQDIKEGMIIIFNKNNLRIIHRVIEIQKVNGETRYYTKGDANAQPDDGYITDKDIIGVSLFKIKYIGYPSIWLRDIFS
ncbi:MAG: signal peptidase I [Firmicutes bacterium]|nr:signal peptidase I [Bacillota bacterium]